jgi:hypothetical protein
MSPAAKNSKATSALVAALRARAAELPPEASGPSTLLSKYASEIDDSASPNEALKKFSEFAMHYKGLRDLVVPGVAESEWFAFVDEVRGLSKSAMRSMGLDRTLLGRLHVLFHGYGE